VKRDDDVQQEKLNLIFTDDRKKRETMKKHSLSRLRKAKAEELRRSLSAGVCLFLIQWYISHIPHDLVLHFVPCICSNPNCGVCFELLMLGFWIVMLCGLVNRYNHFG
jgi:hypothetical protein